MGMMLPGYLTQALNYCGFNWPSTDEDSLRSWGRDVRALAQSVPGARAAVVAAADEVRAINRGPGVDAFLASLAKAESPVHSFDDLANLSSAIATGADVVAGIIVGLKVLVIGQLVLVAAAIAAAIATAGIGSLGVPAAKKAAEIAVEYAIDQILEKLLF